MVTKAATCTEKGVKTYTCSRCNGTKTEEIAINPDNHAYDEGVVTKAATCTETGIKTFTCTRCSNTRTEDIAIDSTNHNYVAVPTKQATCTEEGVMTYTCTRCSDIEKTEPIPKLSHTYDEGVITKQPTCTETGLMTYTCLCGDIHLETVPINPENHTYDEGVVTKTATCTETGIKTFTCTGCSNSYTENIAIDPLNHNGDRELQTTKSWKLVRSDNFSQNDKVWTSTDKREHSSMATWTITLEQDAKISIPYSVSDETSEFEYFLDIKLDDVRIVSEAMEKISNVYETTLQKGTHTIDVEFENMSGNTEVQLTLNDITNTGYGCSKDDHVHELVTEITKEPTCTETGIKTYTCQNCGNNYTEIINALGHNYNDGIVTKEATKTENGEITYTCLRCGDNYIKNEISFRTMPWSLISEISEAGEATNYFAVGDEKELTIGSETYHVQILGFNHDDKSDGTGKAGITVGLKEIMTTKKAMNSTNTNKGGWRDCEMRTYVNNDVYSSLPSDLQAVIKSVDKLTSKGNKSTNIITTSDKLFLLSEVEIFGSTSWSASGEGTQYQYFTDGGSKEKYKSGSSDFWWERSPDVGYANSFCCVDYDGGANGRRASSSCGVVFGFSI